MLGIESIDSQSPLCHLNKTKKKIVMKNTFFLSKESDGGNQIMSEYRTKNLSFNCINLQQCFSTGVPWAYSKGSAKFSELCLNLLLIL